MENHGELDQTRLRVLDELEPSTITDHITSLDFICGDGDHLSVCALLIEAIRHVIQRVRVASQMVGP